jgi:hypothetical protein
LRKENIGFHNNYSPILCSTVPCIHVLFQSIFTVILLTTTLPQNPNVYYLRNKSWKPECVGSFNNGLSEFSILSRARSEG